MTRDRTSSLTFLPSMKADQAIHLNGPTLCQKYFHFIQTILAVEAEASLSLQRMETTCFISSAMTDVSSISVTPVALRIRSVSVECNKMEWWLMCILRFQVKIAYQTRYTSNIFAMASQRSELMALKGGK